MTSKIIVDLGAPLCSEATEVPRFLLVQMVHAHVDGRPSVRARPLVLDTDDTLEIVRRHPKAALVHIDELQIRER